MEKLPTFLGFGVDTWLPIICMLVLLVTGLRLITVELTKPVNPTENSTKLSAAMTEKAGTGQSISFSRSAGAIGAMALASFFTGLGVWVLFSLNNADVKIGETMESLSTFLMTGGTLFAPYAINKITEIFKKTDDTANG